MVWVAFKQTIFETFPKLMAHFQFTIQMTLVNCYIFLMKWILTIISVQFIFLYLLCALVHYCQMCYWWPSHNVSDKYVNILILCLKARSVFTETVVSPSGNLVLCK